MARSPVQGPCWHWQEHRARGDLTCVLGPRCFIIQKNSASSVAERMHLDKYLEVKPTPLNPNADVFHSKNATPATLEWERSCCPASQGAAATVQDGCVDGREIPETELRALLRQQLEYYFSRENLANDTYLLSQMDGDQYVPIGTVANFNQIKRLTRDLNLIVEVLRTSPNVQVDEAGQKVRPNHKRCVLILREIPETTPVAEIESLFAGERCPKFVSCEFAHNSSWYVTFESDEDAQQAYRYLREDVRTFQGRPILARIKAKPISRASFLPPYKNGLRPPPPAAAAAAAAAATVVAAQPPQPPPQQPALLQAPLNYGGGSQAYPPFYPPTMLQTWAPATPPCFDLGTVFSVNGLAPQATYKPVNGGRYLGRPARHSGGPKGYVRNDDSSSRGGGGLLGNYPPHPNQQQPSYATSWEFLPGTKREGGLFSLYARGRDAAAPQFGTKDGFSHQRSAQENGRLRRRKKEDGSLSGRQGGGGGTAPFPQDGSSSSGEKGGLLPKFDLEEAAFPPLPGSLLEEEEDEAASSRVLRSAPAEGVGRLSDVVRGSGGRNRPPTVPPVVLTPPASPEPTEDATERIEPSQPTQTVRPDVPNGTTAKTEPVEAAPTTTAPRLTYSQVAAAMAQKGAQEAPP
ncbi:la-related protein 4-like isoform X2 [Ornithodoros turicata]|uniref:la-related protein 4-like isoform X2 n=1 Tax=Ornithodoros turicata TaxID=34597 RepID=UPI00313A2302